MTQHPESPARSKRPSAAPKKAGRAVRKLAQGTLLAAGIVASHISLPEIDARFHVFNPKLLDRLQAPITRYHE